MGSTKLRSIPIDLSTAVIALTDSGDLVAAVTGQKIIVWAVRLTNSDATKTLTFKSSTTALTGAMLFSAIDLAPTSGGGNDSGILAIPVFETVAGEKLAITASAACNIAGYVIYSTDTT